MTRQDKNRRTKERLFEKLKLSIKEDEATRRGEKKNVGRRNN